MVRGFSCSAFANRIGPANARFLPDLLRCRHGGWSLNLSFATVNGGQVVFDYLNGHEFLMFLCLP